MGNKEMITIMKTIMMMLDTTTGIETEMEITIATNHTIMEVLSEVAVRETTIEVANIEITAASMEVAAIKETMVASEVVAINETTVASMEVAAINETPVALEVAVINETMVGAIKETTAKEITKIEFTVTSNLVSYDTVFKN